MQQMWFLLILGSSTITNFLDWRENLTLPHWKPCCGWPYLSFQCLSFSFWASLVTQTIKNLPARWEIRVGSLGWEDLLEKGMATHSSILAWRIPMDRRAWQAAVHGLAKSRHNWATKHWHSQKHSWVQVKVTEVWISSVDCHCQCPGCVNTIVWHTRQSAQELSLHYFLQLHVNL